MAWGPNQITKASCLQCHSRHFSFPEPTGVILAQGCWNMEQWTSCHFKNWYWPAVHANSRNKDMPFHTNTRGPCLWSESWGISGDRPKGIVFVAPRYLPPWRGRAGDTSRQHAGEGKHSLTRPTPQAWVEEEELREKLTWLPYQFVLFGVSSIVFLRKETCRIIFALGQLVVFKNWA